MKIIPTLRSSGVIVALAAALAVAISACDTPGTAIPESVSTASATPTTAATVTKTTTTRPSAPPRATITTTKIETKTKTEIETKTKTKIETKTKTVTKTLTKTVPSTVTKTKTEPAPADPQASTLDSDEAIRSETARAVSVVQRYWTDLFSTWVDPAGNPVYWVEPTLWNGDGFYDSAAGVIASCSGDSGNADNAFFCGNVVTGTGYAAWDMQLFREEAGFGPLIIYIIVGHEMGHAAQIRFEHDGQAPAVLANRELQADCISGATLHKAAQDGYLTIDESALETALLSYTDAPPGDPHGTAQQRRDWFYRGYDGNIESCLGHR